MKTLQSLNQEIAGNVFFGKHARISGGGAESAWTLHIG